MKPPLDDLYLEWLYNQVTSVILKNPSKTYWNLLRQLYTKEFVWLVPNDDNRVQDGRDLRYQFLEQAGISDVDQAWFDIGCSVLEMLVALARICAFEVDETPEHWFWHLLDNLQMLGFHDAWYRKESNEGVIDERLNRLIFRQYYYDGSFGGLFPLKHPAQDQRDVELWYQMNAYLLENY